MADNNVYSPIPARLHSVATEGVVSGADEIFDDAKGKRQSVINQETDTALDNKYDKDETYSKQELNNLITTPNQDYVTVPTYASLPATGEADTVYRVSNYDGEQSQVDATKYSEYAWDGTQYVFLCVKTQIGEVFDITAYNSNTKYADLAAALGTGGANIPEGLRKGGMSVKFVQSSDNTYVQYCYMGTAVTGTPNPFLDTANWQGVDDEPTAGSKNLVESGGVLKNCQIISTGLSLADYNGRAFVTLNLIKDVKYRVLFNSDIVFNTSYNIACLIRDGGIQGEIIERLEDKTARYLDFTSQGETTIVVYLNSNGITTTLGLVGMQPIDIEKSRAEGAETILQRNIDAEETRAKAAEKGIHDDVDPIVQVVSDLDWSDGISQYTFNGETSKAVFSENIVLSQNGDSIEFEAVNNNTGQTDGYGFLNGSNTSKIGITYSKDRLYVRADDGTWLFQIILYNEDVTNGHVWKLAYEDNNVVLYKDGTQYSTYTGQKTLTLTGVGSGYDYGFGQYPYWEGALKSLSINGVVADLKDIATLTDVTKTVEPGTGNHSFLTDSEKNLLYNPHQNMYVSKTATEMDIYLRHSSGKYIKYPFNYRYKAFVAEVYPSFYDNWGIGRVAICNFDGNSMVEEAKLFYNSEAEMTIKLNGVNIVGGAMHGFDNIVVNNNNREFCIVIDNQKVGESEGFLLKPVQKVEVYQTSQVNSPYTNTGVFGTVNKYWLWENGKFTLTAMFTATESIELEHIYSSLLGCYRRWEGNAENNYLTKSAIKNNYPYKVYDITDGWYISDLVNADKNCTKITAYGDRGIGFSMEVLETNGLSNGGMFISTNNNPYNKIYNKVCAAAELNNGDSLFAKTCWEIL